MKLWRRYGNVLLLNGPNLGLFFVYLRPILIIISIIQIMNSVDGVLGI